MLTWDERMEGESPKICGMCGKGRMGETIRYLVDEPHRIYACLEPSCGHEFVDITHYDSKVMRLREKHKIN